MTFPANGKLGEHLEGGREGRGDEGRVGSLLCVANVPWRNGITDKIATHFELTNFAIANLDQGTLTSAATFLVNVN